MTYEESVSILELYKNTKKSYQAMESKIADLRAILYLPQGAMSNEEGCNGGEKISRAKRFAILGDLIEKYTDKASEGETLCYKIKNEIDRIYTNRDKKEITPLRSSRLKACELFLTYYYILNLDIITIAKKEMISEGYVYNMLLESRQEFYKIVENEDYEKYFRKISSCETM